VEFLQCPRMHAKLFIVDGSVAMVGSANLTGAGIGAKSARKRNFEVAFLIEGDDRVEPFMNYFDFIWMGGHCADCGHRSICPGPADSWRYETKSGRCLFPFAISWHIYLQRSGRSFWSYWDWTPSRCAPKKQVSRRICGSAQPGNAPKLWNQGTEWYPWWNSLLWWVLVAIHKMDIDLLHVTGWTCFEDGNSLWIWEEIWALAKVLSWRKRLDQ